MTKPQNTTTPPDADPAAGMTDLSVLTPAEQAELTGHEQVIAEGLDTFVAVGRALTAIRDRRLYRASHATFEAYCRERWQVGRAHAYRLMTGAEIATLVSPMGDITTERQARELAPLRHDPGAVLVAYARAQVLAGEDRLVTVEHIRQAVAEQVAPALPPGRWPEVPPTLDDARRHLEALDARGPAPGFLRQFGVLDHDETIRRWAQERALNVAARIFLRTGEYRLPPPYFADAPQSTRGPAEHEAARLQWWCRQVEKTAGRFLNWCTMAGIAVKGEGITFAELLRRGRQQPKGEDAEDGHHAALGHFYCWWLTPDEFAALAEDSTPAAT